MTEMPNGGKANPKSLTTKELLSLRRRQRMDFRQLRVEHRQPKKEEPSPAAPPEAQKAANAAASDEQVPAAGAQSNVPAPHSPDCPPGAAPDHGAAQSPGGQRAALAAPEPGDGNSDNEVCSPRELCQGKNHIQQERSQGEVSRTSELYQGKNHIQQERSQGEVNRSSELYQGKNHIQQERSQGEVNRSSELYQGGSDSGKRSSHEIWERITIRTIWVNPRYPELLQDPRSVFQEEAKAGTPPASDEELPAAGTPSPGGAPDSPRRSPCSSRAQLAAQTLSKLQGVPTPPSRSRRVLRALCSLFWCSCIWAPPEE